MSERLDRIVARREALVCLAEKQRAQFATEAAGIQRSLRFVEPAVRAIRTAKSHPFLVLAAAGAIAVLGPQRVLRGGSRAILLAMSMFRLGRVFRAIFRT